ncbi:MAG TPA: hypothetical protein VMR66_06050 [Gemmatimonadota bacterium]|nr:hypothetical protein [Gemmatimonadota bacterium]
MPEGPSERSSRAEGGEIATSTLAEIYAQQGLLGRALAIYRRMLSRAPDDSAIADRIESLERRIVEAGEDEPVPATPEVLQSADVPAAPPTPGPRERLPWDPPEEGEEERPPPPAGEEPSSTTLRPIDRTAFEAWLKGR